MHRPKKITARFRWELKKTIRLRSRKRSDRAESGQPVRSSQIGKPVFVCKMVYSCEYISSFLHESLQTPLRRDERTKASTIGISFITSILRAQNAGDE